MILCQSSDLFKPISKAIDGATIPFNGKKGIPNGFWVSHFLVD